MRKPHMGGPHACHMGPLLHTLQQTLPRMLARLRARYPRKITDIAQYSTCVQFVRTQEGDLALWHPGRTAVCGTRALYVTAGGPEGVLAVASLGCIQPGDLYIGRCSHSMHCERVGRSASW